MVAAAHIILGNPKAASSVLKRFYNTPALRREFALAFDYCNSLSQTVKK